MLTDKATKKIIGEFDANESIKIEINDNLFSIYQNTKQIAANLIGPIEVSSKDGFVLSGNKM